MGLLQVLIDNLHLTGVLLLSTMGIVLIFRTSYTTNFAQTTIGTFGVFFFAATLPKLTSWFTGPTWLYFLITMVISMVVTAGLGVLIDVLLIRNSKRIGPVGKQILTMGIVLILTGLIPMFFGTIPRNVAPIFSGKFDIGSLRITHYRLFTILISTSVIISILLVLRFTKWGLGVRATASNEMVAGMMGVNTRLITAITWAIAGGISTLGAILLGQNGTITIALLADVQIYAFLAAILGGLSTFYGPLVIALFIPSATGIITYYVSGMEKIIIYSVILILVLIRPIGLFGKRIIRKV